ncbi:MAG: LLM class flavin-dependent oxidoreductase [Rhodospirillaceae bacterium]|nr:LLM class flavin-dependent oxidoreductase [Rhodospirillaceae bacterium]MBT3926223.1 LLM class flavin-dependent oxidoreductase [Rhodospirillaceae bacterium]MBT5779732.1 LLM class flavin-dependent oxidoreductase [Rhodospirillaceae bacterium]
MKHAIFTMPIHARDKDYHTGLMEDREAIILADKLGYSEAWIGEHYASGPEQITSPMMFLASLISETTNIKLCSGVICLPQYHPGLVAGQAAMFDHLTKGRFIMGVGPGGLPPDFELFNTMDAERNDMMKESIDIIRQIWAGDPPYDIKGKYWHIQVKDWVHDDIGLGYMCKPLQQPHPPMAISAMSPFSSSVRYAAEMEFIPISANFIGNWSVKSHWQVYAEEAEKHGRTADPEIWRVAKNIHIADTDAEAEAFVKQPGGSFDWYFDYLYRIFDRAQMKGAFVVNKGDDASELTHDMLRDNYTLYGSPETVAEKILALREDIGHFGTLVLTAQDWVDADAMKRSMTLLAEEVMPKVNAAIGSQAAAD